MNIEKEILLRLVPQKKTLEVDEPHLIFGQRIGWNECVNEMLENIENFLKGAR